MSSLPVEYYAWVPGVPWKNQTKRRERREGAEENRETGDSLEIRISFTEAGLPVLDQSTDFICTK
jgi:hypothetical protein